MCGYMMELPAPVARSLTSLTSLTWQYSQVTEIPDVLSLTTTLQKLDLPDNYCLKLGPASARPLLVPKHLTLLELNGSHTYKEGAGNQDFANSLPQSCNVQWLQQFPWAEGSL